MIHFGLRGCKEQKELRQGDVILKTESDGREYLEYFERQTKTRTGEDPCTESKADQAANVCQR